MKSPIEHMLDKVEYTPVVVNEKDRTSDLPFVTHQGTLTIGDVAIQVLVLNNGQRIIPKSEMEKLFGKDWDKKNK